jgi:cytochrome c-type biogenesis protein CcmF
VVIQPLVVWVWIGGMVMVLGTVLALIPGRSRRVDAASPGTSGTPTAEGDESPPTDPAPGDRLLPAGEEGAR